MARARAAFGAPSVSPEALSRSPPKVATASKPAMAPKATSTPKPAATPKPGMAPKPMMTPKPTTTPKLAATLKPGMTPKPAMAPQPATTPKTVKKSSLDDSMFAIPESSTTAASATDNGPSSPTPSRRIVPLEKTAAFSSRAKAAWPKPSDEPKSSDEQQNEKTSEGPTAVLLDIDQDVEQKASAETQVRNLLLSPGMADLTGITFPKEDEIPALSSADFQGLNYANPQLP